jgi:hypothetical protein
MSSLCPVLFQKVCLRMRTHLQSNTRVSALQVNTPFEHVQRMLSLRQALRTSMCPFSPPLNVEREPPHSLAPAMLRLCPPIKVVRLPPHTLAPPPLPPTPIISFNPSGQKLWLRQLWLLLSSR